MTFVGLAKGRTQEEAVLLFDAHRAARYNGQKMVVAALVGEKELVRTIGERGRVETKEELLKFFTDWRAAKRMPEGLDKEIVEHVENGYRDGINSIDGGI